MALLGLRFAHPFLLGGAEPEDMVRHRSRGTLCTLHIWLVINFGQACARLHRTIGLRNTCMADVRFNHRRARVYASTYYSLLLNGAATERALGTSVQAWAFSARSRHCVS